MVTDMNEFQNINELRALKTVDKGIARIIRKIQIKLFVDYNCWILRMLGDCYDHRNWSRSWNSIHSRI